MNGVMQRSEAAAATIKADKYGGWKKLPNLKLPMAIALPRLCVNWDGIADIASIMTSFTSCWPPRKIEREASSHGLGDFLLAVRVLKSRKKRQPTPPSSQRPRRRGGASHLAQRATCGMIWSIRQGLSAARAPGHRRRRTWPGVMAGHALLANLVGGGHSPWPLEDNHVHCRPASIRARSFTAPWPFSMARSRDRDRQAIRCLGPASFVVPTLSALATSSIRDNHLLAQQGRRRTRGH